MTAVPESSVLESGRSSIEIDQEPSLAELQSMVAPEKISYFSEGGASGLAAMRVCAIIRNIQDGQNLRVLLAHTKTLHETRTYYYFPIDRIQAAITKRLGELRV